MIVNGENKPIGIITERDLIKKVLAKGRDPAELKAREIIFTPVITINKDKKIEDVILVMVRPRIKRLSVVNDLGKLVGIITLTDVIRRVPSLIEVGGKLFKTVEVKPEVARIYG